MEKIFLIDVDNTLLDNDHIKNDIQGSLIKILGKNEAGKFWNYHEKFRNREKLVNFPQIIKEYCKENYPKTCELKIKNIFDNIEFKHAFFPEVIRTIKHLKNLGKVFIFTEGDSVYQRAKIEKSGLADVSDEVLLFEHKIDYLPEICQKYEKSQIVIVDDKADFLIKAKKVCPKARTIEVCQGHYCKADHLTHQKIDKIINSISEIVG